MIEVKELGVETGIKITTECPNALVEYVQGKDFVMVIFSDSAKSEGYKRFQKTLRMIASVLKAKHKSMEIKK